MPKDSHVQGWSAQLNFFDELLAEGPPLNHQTCIEPLGEGCLEVDDHYLKYRPIEVENCAIAAMKAAQNCAKMRSFENLGRKFSVVSQGHTEGVKLPLWAPMRKFDTDTVGDTDEFTSEEPSVDALGAAMILAYDTEWQELDGGQNEILSYQIVATEPSGRFSEFVVHVSDGDRMSLDEIIDAARIHLALTPKDLKGREVLVVAHYGAAEWSALRDREKIADFLQLIRKVPVTLRPQAYECRINNRQVPLNLRVMDTFLLAPDGSKSLSKIGDVVGIPKIGLPDGAISKMRDLRRDDPELFELYGIQDSRVTLAFLMTMDRVAKTELGLDKLPITTGGLSVKAFVRSLGQDRYLQLFGLEKVKRYRKKAELVPVTAREHVESYFAAGFSGGLNNATPGCVKPEDGRVVVDIDFVSAYPAAMASIPVIDWSGEGQNGIEYGAVLTDGGAAFPVSLSYVKFSFPPDTRRPTIPVDAGARGIVYPLSGEGYATGPELAAARGKGAKVEILRREHLPFVVDKVGRADLAFAPFLGEMIEKRRRFPKGSIENLLYKLLCNSLYGKLAQGVKTRTVRSFRDRGTLPPSAVTCPAYACAVTGAVRAALIALQDAIEEVGGVVHSATTDGCCASFPCALGDFPVDSSGKVLLEGALDRIPGLMDAILEKPAIRQMQQGLLNMGLPGNPLEVKSIGDGCEVWKTRGYVITRGETVLHVGRAGHQLSAEELSEKAASDRIDTWEMRSLTSAQSIYDGKAEDLVALRQTRRVNLDFDFKLLPDGAGGYRPPRDIDEFLDWREGAEAARRAGHRATEARVALSVVGVQQRGGETAAVRRQLLRAMLQDVAGLRPSGMSDREVAGILGYTPNDAKNAKRRPFQPLPRTPDVERIISEVLAEAGITGAPILSLTTPSA